MFKELLRLTCLVIFAKKNHNIQAAEMCLCTFVSAYLLVMCSVHSLTLVDSF
jgi:hypothetical protein